MSAQSRAFGKVIHAIYPSGLRVNTATPPPLWGRCACRTSQLFWNSTSRVPLYGNRSPCPPIWPSPPQGLSLSGWLPQARGVRTEVLALGCCVLLVPAASVFHPAVKSTPSCCMPLPTPRPPFLVLLVCITPRVDFCSTAVCRQPIAIFTRGRKRVALPAAPLVCSRTFLRGHA